MKPASRSKSRGIRHKERNIEEEQEAIRKAKYNESLKVKNALVKSEFERHKKKIMLSGSEISKTNEAKVDKDFRYLTYI